MTRCSLRRLALPAMNIARSARPSRIRGSIAGSGALAREARGRRQPPRAAAAGPAPGPAPLASLVSAAIDARQASGLVSRLEEEGSSCFRLFHGASEGCPGVTIDKYGDVVLVQSFREVLGDEDLESLEGILPGFCYNPRGRGAREHWAERGGGVERWAEGGGPPDPATFTELGLEYVYECIPGGDPSLFLDFRASRRWVKDNSEGLRVLNTFAYTCGMGIVAAAGGAARVINTDHGSACLEVGAANADLNGLSMEYLQGDFYPTVRQLAGLEVKGRARRRQGKNEFKKIPPQEFDLVVLDPPTRTKTPWGAVDIENDYSSLAKPALLMLSEGGRLLATNHSAKVGVEEWVDAVQRCGKKAGRTVTAVEVLNGDGDFPSYDGSPPLSVAVFSV